jgi:hypothetical protein
MRETGTGQQVAQLHERYMMMMMMMMIFIVAGGRFEYILTTMRHYCIELFDEENVHIVIEYFISHRLLSRFRVP